MYIISLNPPRMDVIVVLAIIDVIFANICWGDEATKFKESWPTPCGIVNKLRTGDLIYICCGS